MDAGAQEAEILRVAEKLAGYFSRDVLTCREVVNQLTDELAYHRRTDLAGAVLQRLPAGVLLELRSWITEVLRQDYRYRPFIIGDWPSEEFRQAYVCDMQSQLVTLAVRFWGLLGDSRS
jgi:hypothetical protein